VAFALIDVRRIKKPVIVEKKVEKLLPVEITKVIKMPVTVAAEEREEEEQQSSGQALPASLAPPRHEIPGQPPRKIHVPEQPRTPEEEERPRYTLPVVGYKEIEKQAPANIDIKVEKLTPTGAAVIVRNGTRDDRLVVNIVLDSPVDLGDWPGWRKTRVLNMYEYVRGSLLALMPLPPGRVYAEYERFPKPLPPGRYRLSIHAVGSKNEKIGVVEFEVEDGRVKVLKTINISRVVGGGKPWTPEEAYSRVLPKYREEVQQLVEASKRLGRVPVALSEEEKEEKASPPVVGKQPRKPERGVYYAI
jgi:hypothetical protein